VTSGWEFENPARARAPARRHRVDAHPESVECGQVSLVLAVVEPPVDLNLDLDFNQPARATVRAAWLRRAWPDAGSHC
jgi:hypothetical protein